MVVIAAVDRRDRAARILAEADVLSEKFDDTLHVLHVMKRSEAVQIEEDSVSNSDSAVPVDELRERATERVKDLVDVESVASDVEVRGRIGDPAAEIVDHAAEHDARYIVVSPRKRSKTGKMLFGSVAQTVILNANCPVVTIVDDETDQ